MIIEQRTYTLHPHVNMKDFLDAYEHLGLETQQRILGKIVGYFTIEFGTQNRVTHFWRFADLEERRRKRAELAADPQWQKCITEVRPMLKEMENAILNPTSFSPSDVFGES